MSNQISSNYRVKEIPVGSFLFVSTCVLFVVGSVCVSFLFELKQILSIKESTQVFHSYCLNILWQKVVVLV